MKPNCIAEISSKVYLGCPSSKILGTILEVDDGMDKRTRKVLGNTDYSDQKQHRQHKDQQNNNKLKTKIGRKAIVRIFQVTNKRNLTRKDQDMSKKGKH